MLTGWAWMSSATTLLGVADPVRVYEDFASLDLISRCRAGIIVGRSAFEGRFRPPLSDAAVMPRAVQQPLPIWIGVGGSPDSAERAGRLGLPMTLGYIGGTVSRLRPLVDTYRAAGERAGHQGALKVAISTHFYAGADRAQARAVYPYYHEYLRPKRPGGRGFVVDRAMFEAGTSNHGAIMIGSAAEITDKTPRRSQGARP